MIRNVYAKSYSVECKNRGTFYGRALFTFCERERGIRERERDRDRKRKKETGRERKKEKIAFCII